MPRIIKSGVKFNDDDSVFITQSKHRQGKGSKSADNGVKHKPNLNLTDESNPLPCNGCRKPVTEIGICCDKCDLWYHHNCGGLSKTDYNAIDKNAKIKGIKWFCDNCLDQEAESIIEPAVSMAKHSLQIDVLIRLVESLQQQNAVILELLTKEKKQEEQVGLKVQVTEAITDQKEREEKKDNIIIFNLEEGEGKDDAANLLSDTEKVKSVLKVVCPETDTEELIACEVGRMGTKKNGPDAKPRPVRVTLRAGARSQVLKSAKKLKNSAHNKVGLSPDRTKSELAEFRVKRAEFIKRKNDGEDVVWYKGESILRADLNNLSETVSENNSKDQGSRSTNQGDN